MSEWYYSLQANFVDNPKTTLADLLELNLHTYEDEVKNIVDKAVKEMSMEKIIKVSYIMKFSHIWIH